jgi:hypothetical protein
LVGKAVPGTDREDYVHLDAIEDIGTVVLIEGLEGAGREGAGGQVEQVPHFLHG